MSRKAFTGMILKPVMISTFLILLLPFAAFAAPVILYTDILSGPNTGGENNRGAYLSILGKGFGITRGTSTVTIGGKEVAEYIQWGVPSRVYESHGIQVISMRIGSAITGLNQPIVVTANGEASNSNHTFSVRPGKIYYVKIGGNDANDGLSIATAKATPQSTESIMVPGDHTIVLGGTYDLNLDEAIRLLDTQGTASDYIAFIGMPGETPLFRRSNGSQTFFYINNTAGYVVVSNFVADGNGTSQVSVRDGAASMKGRFVNIESYGLRGTGGGTGAWGIKGNGIKIFGNSIHDQGCNKLYHNIYVSKLTTDNVEIGWNHIYNNNDYCGGVSEPGGRGIQVFEPTDGINWMDNIVIHDNVVHDIAREGIGISNAVKTAEVYNNIIYRAGTVTGSGFRSSSRDCASVNIYHNTFYDNDVANDGNAHIEFENDGNAPTCYTVKNNIIQSTHNEAYYRATGSPAQNLSDVVRSNNLFFGAGGIPAGETNSINVDPKFIDPTNPARNFQLQVGSPAIDAGVGVPVARDFNGTVRPQGSSFDIGSYEICAVNCVVVDTTPPARPTGVTVIAP